MADSMEAQRVIGLMSGTSLDGVDAAGLITDGVRVQGFGPSLTLPYPPALRQRLRALLDLAPRLGLGLTHADAEIGAVAAAVTAMHGAAVAALGWPADLVGFPGQTILHQPERHRTWQIGDPMALASATGLPVACDFRVADVTGGGQGAPLAPVFHAALVARAELPRPCAVLNLGGVANVTWIGADGQLVAFDTGPGNALLDDWAALHTGSPFDQNGRLARAGQADATVLATLLADRYFARPAPKSLDRLAFAATVADSGLSRLSAADGAATLVAFTTGAVARAVLPAPPAAWVVGGGGRRNPALMAALAAALAPAPLHPAEAVGWDGDALEAQAFAYLAMRTRRGLPLSYPGTTGVPAPWPGGRMVNPPPAPSTAG